MIMVYVLVFSIHILSSREQLLFLWEYLETIPTFLESAESTLLTLPAIFIGIYFTVFSILGTVKVESTIAKISKEDFKQLVTYITNACLGAFAFLIVTLITVFITNNTYYAIYIQLPALFYMLISSFRFAYYIQLIYKNDLSNLHDQIEEELQEIAKQREILYKLDRYYLNKLEDLEERKKAKYDHTPRS